MLVLYSKVPGALSLPSQMHLLDEIATELEMVVLRSSGDLQGIRSSSGTLAKEEQCCYICVDRWTLIIARSDAGTKLVSITKRKVDHQCYLYVPRLARP